MTKVLAQGVFDIIHPGHLYYLEKSAEKGDKLVVVIARDDKIDKKTYFNEEERRRIVQGLETVDKAILGNKGSIFNIVAEVEPDIITLGYDQKHEVQEIKSKAEEIIGNVKVERIKAFEDYSSSDIREFIEDEP